MKEITIWVLGILVAGLVIFGLNYASLKNYEFFAPKFQEAQTKTFKESAAYNEGMQRDLEMLRLEYLKADEESRAVMRPILIHRFSVYPAEKLTADQRAFLAQIKGNNSCETSEFSSPPPRLSVLQPAQESHKTPLVLKLPNKTSF